MKQIAKGGIEPTRLYSKNREVEAINKRRLQGLRATMHRYSAVDGGDKILLKRLNNTQGLESLAQVVHAPLLVLNC